MTLEPADLDDRTYAEFLENARKRIPVHATEWTDHNAHDPGVTILETLAWVAETYGYQLDRVTDAHRRKYVELLTGWTDESTSRPLAELTDDPPRPPVSASVDLSLSISAAVAGTDLPEGTTVSAIRTDGTTARFETTAAVTLTGAAIDGVVSVYPGGRADHTTANETPGRSFEPFGPEAEPGSAVYVGFDVDPFADSGTLDLFVEYDDDGLVPPAAHGSEDSTFVPSVRIDWQFCADYDRWYRTDPGADAWVSFEVEKDETEQFYRGGRIRLGVPSDPTVRDQWTTWRAGPKSILGREPPARWLRGVVVAGDETGAGDQTDEESPDLVPCRDPPSTGPRVPPRHDVPPRVESLRLNVVSARHRTTVTPGTDGVVLRRPDGGVETTARPDQAFVFPERPVLDHPAGVGADVVLRGESGAVDDSWEEVPTLDRAGPHEHVYHLEHKTGTVRFGDGIRGAVPPAGATVVSRRYVVGGGTDGNVPAADWESAVEGIKTVSPLADAAGGADAETVDEALSRLRREFRTPYRAVSLADYRYVARHTPGLRVGRAAAVVEDSPSVAGCEPHRRVVVVAVPYNRSARPEPSEGFLEAVECHLKRHVLLTDRVRVAPPTYVGVGVRTVVRPEAEVSVAEIEHAVRAALDSFLDPLRGYDGDGWPFGRPVYPSELYDVVGDVPGVDCPVDLSVAATGGTVDADGAVVIEPTALVYPTDHDVIVRTDRDTCGPGV